MKTTTWNLSVFQRRVGRSIFWSTLGLGRFNVTCRLKHAATGQRDLQTALGASLAKAELSDLMICRTQTTAWLERVHLDLRLANEGLHLSGLAPLVVETLAQPDGGTAEIAYSPLRPQDFFVVDPAQDLSRQANRFFAVAWRGVDATEADSLLLRGHEKLLLVAVKVSWRAFGEEKPRADRLGLQRRKKEKVLSLLAEDWTARVAADEEGLAALPPRPTPLEQRLLKALNGRPTSFAFIGPAGCGKSTLVRTLTARLLLGAHFLEHGQAAAAPRVFRLSGRRLIAGMSYFGQWEQRCHDLLEECRELRSAGSRQWRDLLPAGGERLPIILWVEDLAAWSQIGQSRESRRCLADVFLTPLRRGEILIFGEATPEAFALLEDEAPAFAAAFRRAHLSRPDNSGILSILLARARQLENECGLSFDTSALRALLETVPAIYGEEAHPGQSCRLLDQVAKDSAGQVSNVIFMQFHRQIAAETGMPRILINEGELPMSRLRDHFGQRVIGQDEAVEVVCELLCTLKAGLSDPRRPHAVLLFSGPTGTGKTELAKALAAWLYGDEKRLLRFDMGEHADPDAVARLVGDRARPQGLLTEAVRAQPFAVLLFDEIEKADAGVLALLLQVFEDGRLTDALGQVADFRQCVLILTSNLGSSPGARVGLSVDPGDARAAAAEAHQAIERFFAPELWNRIDRIVTFRPLAPDVARRIGEIELYRIFSRRGLAERGVFVRTDAAVLDRVLEQGFDARSGARGVKRYLEREVVPALTEAIAEADPAAFLLLHLEAPAPGGFAVQVEPIGEAAPLPTDPEIDRLYELPPARLLGEVPAWLGRLDHLEQELRAGLEHERSEQLRAWRESSGGADALHELDTLRGRLLDLRQQFEAELDRQRPDEGELREAALTFRLTRPSPRRREWTGKKRLRHNDPRAAATSAFQPIAAEQMVALVTEILWLEFAGRSAARGRGAAEGRGQIAVELQLISEHRPRTGGGAATLSASLQQELAKLLLADEVTLESFIADTPQGQVLGRSRASLDELLEKRPRRLFLILSGTLLAERLLSDVGAYVRVRSDGNQEIVRLLLHPGEDAAALLSSSAGLKSASSSLLQLIHWEAPPEGEWSLCQVEDFALCVEDKRPARHLAEVLLPLRRRRQMAILARERG